MSSHGETPDRGRLPLGPSGPVGPAVSGQKILVLTCQMCGYQWLPRVPKPRRCPGCQSPEWERKEEEVKP